MNQANSEPLNTPTNLDVDLKDNELNDDDLDAVSGGYPGDTPQEQAEERKKMQKDGLWVGYDGNNILTTFDKQTGQTIKTAPDGASWRE